MSHEAKSDDLQEKMDSAEGLGTCEGHVDTLDEKYRPSNQVDVCAPSAKARANRAIGS
jgi:hypothetical protein